MVLTALTTNQVTRRTDGINRDARDAVNHYRIQKGCRQILKRIQSKFI